MAGGAAPRGYYIELGRPYRVGTGFQWLEEKTEAGYFEELNNQVTTLREKAGEATSLYILVESRIKRDFKHLLGVDPTTRSEWQEFKDRLSQENLVYNNGYMQFYKIGGR